MTRATVSLCMIARDEEKNLAQCLKGLAGLVSEIIVVDTGSKDDTRQVAAGLGAKVFEFPWIDDFSAARNESWRHASGDFIFWLDADDRIDDVNLKRLGELFATLTTDPSQIPVYVMSCISSSRSGESDVGVSHTRLFPNRPAFRWVGRVHERVEFGEAAVHYVHTKIVIRHEGYEDADQLARKKFRSKRILEQEYVANPDDVWNLFYLGREHHWQGNMSEAIRFFQRSIRLDPLNRHPTTPFALLLAAESLKKLNRKDEALRTLDEGLSRIPDFGPLAFTKVCMLREWRRFAEAEQILRRLLAVPLHQVKQGAMWVDLQRERWRVMLGHLLHDQGRFSEARAECRQVLNEHPDFIEAWFALGQLEIDLGKPRDAEPIARKLMAFPNGGFESAVLWSQIAVIDCKFDDARHWISRALAIRPNDVLAHTVRSVLYFREGLDWEQCRQAHEALLSVDPNHHEARQRLQQIHARLASRKPAMSVNEPGNVLGVDPSRVPLSNLGAGCGLAFSC